MPYGNARYGAGYAAVFDVQIARTDGSERHAHDRVAFALQFGQRFFFQGELPGSLIYICQHSDSSAPIIPHGAQFCNRSGAILPYRREMFAFY